PTHKMALDDVCKCPLKTAKVESTANQQGDRYQKRDERDWPRSRVGPEQSPAKTFHDSHHWVDPIDRPPRLGKHTAGVCDRSGEKPKLHQKRDGILHIAKLDVHC